MKLEIVAPDYYPEFRCLAQKCQYTCCGEWEIYLTRAEYNKYRSKRKSAQLQKIMVHAFERKKNGTEEEYASIRMDKNDMCPLLNEEGLCQLQVECGYNTLSKICKEFPRKEHVTPFQVERYCSTGCEAVLYALLEKTEELHFITLPVKKNESVYTIDDEKWGKITDHKPVLKYYREIQQFCMGILQNRRYPLASRILMLGLAFQDFDENMDESSFLLWLKAKLPLLQYNAETDKALADLPTDLAISVSNAFQLFCTEQLLSDITQQSIPEHKKVIDKVLSIICENRLEKDLNLEEQSFKIRSDVYEKAMAHFDELPFTAHLMEKLMVHHIFESQFPFGFNQELYSVWERYALLCIVYNFLRVMAVGYMADTENPDDLVHVLTVCSRRLFHNYNHVLFYLKEMKKNQSTSLGHLAYLLKC